MEITQLKTDRLLLRQWQQSDFLPFAALNADPQVMEYFPSVLSSAQSDVMARRCQELIAERGWGLWAVELLSTGAFIGFVGLHTPKETLPCAPCVEVGWRLLAQYWGKGYATEAAKSALAFAFDELCVPEVVSFTSVENQRSRQVMERLGMSNSEANFLHPDLPAEHELAEHVLYKISAEQYRSI